MTEERGGHGTLLERPVLTIPASIEAFRSEERAARALGASTAVLRSATWFGLVIGLMELGLILALKRLRDPSPGFFRMNRHAVWMVPAADFMLFVAVGAVLAVVARFRPRLAWRVSIPLFGFLGGLVLLLTYRPLFAWASVLLACGLGHRLSRGIERNGPRFQALVRRTLPGLALAAGCLAGSSFEGNVSMTRRMPSGPPPPAGAPNVLLIVLDTVRADRLSVSGYPRPTTPNLERLARQGIRFAQARSTAPWTLPSHASIMTGRWPHELSADFDGPLDATYPTLAEFLSSKGYATGGFVANLIYTSAESGLARGFSHYEDHDISLAGMVRCSALGSRLLGTFLAGGGKYIDHPHELLRRKDAAEIGGELLGWLAEQPADRPFFAFLNFFDVHNPYIPPEGFRGRFGGRARSTSDRKLMLEWFIQDKKALTSRQFQLVNDAYDDCLAYLDEQLGSLFDELARRGRLENTLVIITADHGEHLGEHALYGHASSLYDQEVHVPLLIIPPKGVPKGLVIDQMVSLRDIPRTVVDLAGLGPDGAFPGRSLARFWAADDGPARSPREVALSEVEQPAKATPNQGRSPVFRGAMQAIFADGKAYIHNGDGAEELYDLENDPGQSNDLVDGPEALLLLKRFRGLFARLLADEPHS